MHLHAAAKINLTLHVIGRRADGYHMLDSVVVFTELGDRLSVTPAETRALSVSGPFSEGVPTDQRNLVWKAADLAGLTGHIALEKNLPHGAGIGGGSSDAAAILRHYGGAERAADLGADVPVCLRAVPQRMQGIGEVLSPVAVAPLHLVLVNPGVHVPTANVFKALVQKDNAGHSSVPDLPEFQSALDWLTHQRNDLEAPAVSVAPEIGTVLEALHGAGAALVRMSGSGSTCFGIYPNGAAASEAAAGLARAHPKWWVQATRSLA